MKTIYSRALMAFSFLCFSTIEILGQQPTTTTPSIDCNFTYTFNTTDEGFSSPSIYSDDNDLSFFWDGSKLIENSGLNGFRTASTISGIFVNNEVSQTTLGFDYVVPNNAEYRIRIISGSINPPLEILGTTANGPVWTEFPATSGSLCLTLKDNDLPFGTMIRYEITIRATAGGNMIIDNFRKSSQNSPLPVTFLGFIAKENPTGTTKLIWNVSEEINVEKYLVESSVDGQNFTTIGTVSASGKDNYSFTTADVVKGNVFFRIKSVDYDRATKYSGIIRIKSNFQDAKVNLYPVPTNDVLYIEHRKLTEPAKITIIGVDGRIVYQTLSQPNSYQTSVNVRTFRQGIYFVKYEESTGVIHSSKFIKN